MRAKKTWPRLERVQRQLGMSAWPDVPNCDPDPSNKEGYLYDPLAWGRQAEVSWGQSPSMRLIGKRPESSPVALRGAEARGMPVGPVHSPALRHTAKAPESSPVALYRAAADKNS